MAVPTQTEAQCPLEKPNATKLIRGVGFVIKSETIKSFGGIKAIEEICSRCLRKRLCLPMFTPLGDGKGYQVNNYSLDIYGQFTPPIDAGTSAD